MPEVIIEQGPDARPFTIYPETPVVQADLQLAQLKGGSPLLFPTDFNRFQRTEKNMRIGTETVGGGKHKGSWNSSYTYMIENGIAPRNILEDVYLSHEDNHFPFRKDEIHYYAKYYNGNYIKAQDWWATIQNEILGERIDNYIKLLMYYPLVGWQFQPYYPYQLRWWWSKDKKSIIDWFPRQEPSFVYYDLKLFHPDYPSYTNEEVEQQYAEYVERIKETQNKNEKRYLISYYPAAYIKLRRGFFNEENKYIFISQYGNFQATDFSDNVASPLELFGAVVTKIERVIYKVILRELIRTWEMNKPGFMDEQTIRLQISTVLNDLYKGTHNILDSGYAALIEQNARGSVPVEIIGGYDTPRTVRLSLPNIAAIAWQGNAWTPLDYIMTLQNRMLVNQALIGQLKLLAAKYSRVTDPNMQLTEEEEEAIDDPERNMMLIVDVEESEKRNTIIFKDITANAIQTGEKPRKVVRPEYNQYVDYLKNIKSVLDYFEEDYSIADIPMSKYEKDRNSGKTGNNLLPWLIGGAAVAYVGSEML